MSLIEVDSHYQVRGLGEEEVMRERIADSSTDRILPQTEGVRLMRCCR